ncbi:MAG: ABC transporter ATP-binding protein [Vicingaceae bacterium]|nr:ABC transporter ATP-binding protein [Vicingaceae bacterium]
MKKNIAIKVENLSKQYRLGEIGTGSLSHDLNRFFAKIRGKEDPYSIIGQTNDRTATAESDYVWALKDINFEVEQGEVLGIIGRNGAGKSTLLKLISQITAPTTGAIKAKGRIASLLEVGTGMHPEMTARENIFLNGAILGMTKKEIKAKLDEIIDFAGCQLYVDTPLKRFSSGMRVRLGFAVAAFLEPEILIVDEVLAVGDAEFQKKAIGKMKDISAGGGRTVLFVSHNMASVINLCTTGIVLENGQITFNGSANDAVDCYLKNSTKTSNNRKWDLVNAPGNEKIKVTEISIKESDGKTNFTIDSKLTLSYKLYTQIENATLGTTIVIKNSKEDIIFSDGAIIASDRNSKKGFYFVQVNFPYKILNSDSYSIDLIVGENRRYALLNEENILNFEILFGGNIKHDKKLPGIIYQELNWSIKHSEEV